MAEAAKAHERTVYEAGAGRKTFLSPGVSDPAAVLRQPAGHAHPPPGHGLWFDTVGLIIFSALFTALMALLVVQLYQSLRSRVELGDTAVKSPCHRAAAPRRCCASSTPRSPTTRSTASRRARAVRRPWRPCCCAPPASSPRTAGTSGSATSTRTTSTRPCPSPRSAPRSPSAPASRRRRRHGAPLDREAVLGSSGARRRWRTARR